MNETFDKISLLKSFYNFSDLNINKNCNFLIYPNEYTNSNILKQKYCININIEIIDKLLDKNKEFHDNLKPEFGSNYILTTDEYATISDR